jgi:hypothetical protein
LLSQEVLHADIVVLAKQLKHPVAAAHDVQALFLERRLLGVIRFDLMVPLQHAHLFIVEIVVIRQNHLELILTPLLRILPDLEVVVDHTPDLLDHDRVVRQHHVTVVFFHPHQDAILASGVPSQ